MLNNNTFSKFIDAGFDVVPTHNKVPMASKWQDGLSASQINDSIDYHKGEGKDVNGIGLVMTNNLEALDFDTKHDESGTMMEEYTNIVISEKPEIYDKIVIQKTQSGGQHWIYKCEKRDSNTKLANNKNKEAIIETRGIGGQIVIQPTSGYKFIKGGLNSIQEISVKERAYLWGLARTFNLYQDEVKIKQSKESLGTGKTAFNDYNDQCSLQELEDLFKKHGWSIKGRVRGNTAIKRAGSDNEHSGYIFNDTLITYIHSTSTAFEPNSPYMPYAVYTVLEHGGDYTAAARELYSLGYGEKEKTEHPTEQYNDNISLEKIQKTRGGGYVKFDLFEDKVDELYLKGNPKGCRTRFNIADPYISYMKKHTTYIYASPTSGKTQFAFSEMVYLAEKYDWKFAIYPSESGDPADVLSEVASIYIGKLHHSNDKILKMSPQENARAKEFFRNHFFCIDPLFLGNSPTVDAEYIIDETKYIEEVEGIRIDCIFIDPVTELDEKENERTDKFIKRVNTLIRKDAKANDRHNILVYHVAAQQPMIDKDTNKTYFAEPHPREIAGGQNAYKQGDQVINVYRPTAGMVNKSDNREYLENETHVIIHKSRPKGVGKKGRFILYFDWKTNRYYENPEFTRYSDPIGEVKQSEINLQPTYNQPISLENNEIDGIFDNTKF